MESRLGQDFSDTRIHDDAVAGDAARALNAEAFTVGRDVYFAPGKYRSHERDPLLAHELTHVAQQKHGEAAATGNNSQLEAQAERTGHAIAMGSGKVETPAAGGRAVQRKAADTTSSEEKKKEQKPSWLERVGHGISSAAHAVGRGVAAAGGAVWQGIKAAGHGIAVAADAVWNGLQWVGKQLWAKVTGVFERIANWIGRLPERLARLVVGLWEGVKTLRPWSLSWWESLAHVDTWTGFLKWLGANMLRLVEVLGLGEAYQTVMDFVKFNTRKLSGGELSRASGVFGASINFEMVRVDENAVLGPAFSHREYTAFHTISGWGNISDDTLIHELTHVWQYERSGVIYIAEALHAQIKLGGTAAYDYQGTTGLQAAKNAGHGILSFNREQQAQIVQDYYLIKNNRPPHFGGATRLDLPLYAYFVKEVSTLNEGSLSV